MNRSPKTGCRPNTSFEVWSEALNKRAADAAQAGDDTLLRLGVAFRAHLDGRLAAQACPRGRDAP